MVRIRLAEFLLKDFWTPPAHQCCIMYMHLICETGAFSFRRDGVAAAPDLLLHILAVALGHVAYPSLIAWPPSLS